MFPRSVERNTTVNAFSNLSKCFPRNAITRPFDEPSQRCARRIAENYITFGKTIGVSGGLRKKIRVFAARKFCSKKKNRVRHDSGKYAPYVHDGIVKKNKKEVGSIRITCVKKIVSRYRKKKITAV